MSNQGCFAQAIDPRFHLWWLCGLVLVAAISSALAVDPSMVSGYGVLFAAVAVIHLSVAVIVALVRRSLGLRHFLEVLCIGLVLGISFWHFPMRAAFFMTETKIVAAAGSILTGNPPAVPFRIGTFRILKADECRPGIACLWTNLDPAGKTVLVSTRCEKARFNDFMKLSLGSMWCIVVED